MLLEAKDSQFTIDGVPEILTRELQELYKEYNGIQAKRARRLYAHPDVIRAEQQRMTEIARRVQELKNKIEEYQREHSETPYVPNREYYHV